MVSIPIWLFVIMCICTGMVIISMTFITFMIFKEIEEID